MCWSMCRLTNSDFVMVRVSSGFFQRAGGLKHSVPGCRLTLVSEGFTVVEPRHS